MGPLAGPNSIWSRVGQAVYSFQTALLASDPKAAYLQNAFRYNYLPRPGLVSLFWVRLKVGPLKSLEERFGIEARFEAMNGLQGCAGASGLRPMFPCGLISSWLRGLGVLPP